MPHLKPGSLFFSIKSSFVRSGGRAFLESPDGEQKRPCEVVAMGWVFSSGMGHFLVEWAQKCQPPSFCAPLLGKVLWWPDAHHGPFSSPHAPSLSWTPPAHGSPVPPQASVGGGDGDKLVAKATMGCPAQHRPWRRSKSRLEKSWVARSEARQQAQLCRA